MDSSGEYSGMDYLGKHNCAERIELRATDIAVYRESMPSITSTEDTKYRAWMPDVG